MAVCVSIYLLRLVASGLLRSLGLVMSVLHSYAGYWDGISVSSSSDLISAVKSERYGTCKMASLVYLLPAAATSMVGWMVCDCVKGASKRGRKRRKHKEDR